MSSDLETLIIKGIELKPYYYEEKIFDEFLEIETKVIVSKDQDMKIRKAYKEKGYFPVTRKGISDEPTEMRFGLPLWSEFNEDIKHRLILVEKGSKSGLNLFQPEVSNIQKILLKNKLYIEKLCSKLVEKNIVEERLLDEIKEEVKQEHLDFLVFYETDDIDK